MKVGLSGEEWWKVGALAHGMLGGASGGSVLGARESGSK